LAIHEKYNGQDTVQVGNGTGLQILHLGSCSINTNTHPLALNNVLRVPEISKHLLSVHKLARDNNIFFEFHPWYFFIKDQATQSLLLEGRCESGLYPLKPADVAAIKQVFLNFSASLSQWHARFGHPSTQVVQPFCIPINFHVVTSLVCLQFIIRVSLLKVINCHIVFLYIAPPKTTTIYLF
jgi:hypothetical protein